MNALSLKTTWTCCPGTADYTFSHHNAGCRSLRRSAWAWSPTAGTRGKGRRQQIDPSPLALACRCWKWQTQQMCLDAANFNLAKGSALPVIFLRFDRSWKHLRIAGFKLSETGTALRKAVNPGPRGFGLVFTTLKKPVSKGTMCRIRSLWCKSCCRATV